MPQVQLVEGPRAGLRAEQPPSPLVLQKCRIEQLHSREKIDQMDPGVADQLEERHPSGRGLRNAHRPFVVAEAERIRGVAYDGESRRAWMVTTCDVCLPDLAGATAGIEPLVQHNGRFGAGNRERVCRVGDARVVQWQPVQIGGHPRRRHRLDGMVAEADPPVVGLGERPHLVHSRPPCLRCEEARCLGIRGPLVDRSRRFARCRVGELTVSQELCRRPGREADCPHVDGIGVAYIGVLGGSEPSLVQNDAAVESIREPLQDGPRDWFAAQHLPEGGGAAPVVHLIAVVERPDAMSGSLEHRTPDDAEPEAQDEVQVVRGSVRRLRR